MANQPSRGQGQRWTLPLEAVVAVVEDRRAQSKRRPGAVRPASKQAPGMRWSLDGANPVLVARQVRASGSFDDCWQMRLDALRRDDQNEPQCLLAYDLSHARTCPCSRLAETPTLMAIPDILPFGCPTTSILNVPRRTSRKPGSWPERVTITAPQMLRQR